MRTSRHGPRLGPGGIAAVTVLAVGLVLVGTGLGWLLTRPASGPPRSSRRTAAAPAPTPLGAISPEPTSPRSSGRRPPGRPRLLPGNVRVIIPAIGVNAPIVKLGLNLDGTLQVPTVFSEAGWWSGGPFPGDPGPAVVVGHVSSRAGPGVFYRLRSLGRGDRIEISRPDGTVASFDVTSSMEVSKSRFPSDLVYGPVAGKQLRLITCGGAFNPGTGHFVDNIIVFASFVSSARG